MITNNIPAASTGWPELKENRFNGTVTLIAKNYLTPKAMLRGMSWGSFFFGLAVFGIFIGVSMLFAGEPASAGMGIVVLVISLPLALYTRKSKREDLARSFFGKKLVIHFNETAIVIKGGLKKRLVIPIQYGFEMKTALQENPELLYAQAEAHGTNDDRLQKRIAVLQQTRQCILTTGTSINVVAVPYNLTDCDRLMNGIQIALRMVYERSPEQNLSPAAQAL